MSRPDPEPPLDPEVEEWKSLTAKLTEQEKDDEGGEGGANPQFTEGGKYQAPGSQRTPLAPAPSAAAAPAAVEERTAESSFEHQIWQLINGYQQLLKVHEAREELASHRPDGDVKRHYPPTAGAGERKEKKKTQNKTKEAATHPAAPLFYDPQRYAPPALCSYDEGREELPTSTTATAGSPTGPTSTAGNDPYDYDRLYAAAAAASQGNELIPEGKKKKKKKKKKTLMKVVKVIDTSRLRTATVVEPPKTFSTMQLHTCRYAVGGPSKRWAPTQTHCAACNGTISREHDRFLRVKTGVTRLRYD